MIRAGPRLLAAILPSTGGALAHSAQDIGYLKALYNGANALKLWMQKSLAAERMARGSAGASNP
jgi:hypothetical protein